MGAFCRALMSSLSLAALLRLVGSATAADLPETMPVKGPPISTAYDWTGFYLGGHIGYALGNSNFTATTTPGAPSVSGSLDLFQGFDGFKEQGSFLEGLQVGYNYMFQNRLVIGVEADASFPSFQSLEGLSIGGASTFLAPGIGWETYSETVLAFGTVRARVGYAFGDWLLYATGGLGLTTN
jgi:high affinity Mn2+ porin